MLKNQKIKDEHLPNQIPILPLSDCVLFPGVVIPLLIDDQKQIELVDNILNQNLNLGIVLQRTPELIQVHPQDLYSYGCSACIRRIVEVTKGVVRILVDGIQRFEITHCQEKENGILIADVSYRPDILDEKFERSLEYQQWNEKITQLFWDYAKVAVSFPEDVRMAAQHANNAAVLSNIIPYTLPLDITEKQHVLSIADVKKRIQVLIPLLEREIQDAKLGKKIIKETSDSLARAQREHYLRAQLRAIHKELGDEGSAEIRRLRSLSRDNKLSEVAQEVLQRELDRLEVIPYISPEYVGVRNYLDWLVNLPWEKEDALNLSIEKAKQVLNKNHYGLDSVKERLLEYISVMKVSHNTYAPIICLVGPPGVGKTSLGRSVATALGRKFYSIALGGMHDVAELRGHRRTYVGAQPGRIIQALRRLSTKNPVILLDEIDKVGGTSMGGETMAALLEILDTSQNAYFTDLFLEIPFDLSHVLFITTANLLEPIHPALRDRMEIIEIPGYTLYEKSNIAFQHTIPNLLHEAGLPNNFIKIDKEALCHLIEDYTREGGVREMERQLSALIRKIVCNELSHGGTSNLVEKSQPKISTEEVRKLLGRPVYSIEPLAMNTPTGVALGLAWTPSGGDAVPVEVTRMPGHGELILTGNLGKILMESVRNAISFLRSEGKDLKLDFSDYDKHDLHVHIPSASVAKDGSSAGITFVVAIASLLSGKKVRPATGMTGEITLRGRLLAVSGIREKTLSAARFGIKDILMPMANKPDWEEIPDVVKKKIHPHFFEYVKDAVQYALSI